MKNRLTGETNPVFFPADPESAGRRRTGRPRDRPSTRSPTATASVRPRSSSERSSRAMPSWRPRRNARNLAEKLEADAVEMEGAAVAQVCYQRGIGCLVIRSISDKADESAVMDKQKFYALAAKNSASLVREDPGPERLTRGRGNVEVYFSPLARHTDHLQDGSGRGSHDLSDDGLHHLRQPGHPQRRGHGQAGPGHRHLHRQRRHDGHHGSGRPTLPSPWPRAWGSTPSSPTVSSKAARSRGRRGSASCSFPACWASC